MWNFQLLIKKQAFWVLLLLSIVTLPCSGFNYIINFTGTGVSTSVGKVTVLNLTQGTTGIVPAGYSLELTDELASIGSLTVSEERMTIIPNRLSGKYTLSFYAKQSGVTQINVYSIDGRTIAGTTANLQSGFNSFQLSLPIGSFVVHVSGNGYAYNSKIMNPYNQGSNPEIAYISSLTRSKPQKANEPNVGGVTIMNYNLGDRLLFKGEIGDYCSIMTEIPFDNKTINFEFVECKDADGNSYPVVKIGSQTWMAENLKTTKYSNGDSILQLTKDTLWSRQFASAYCNYNNDTTYSSTYGRLYNEYAIRDVRNIAPVGWHVSTDAEWNTLMNDLDAVVYESQIGAYTDGSKLKETGTLHWNAPNFGANNISGFTALPGGFRDMNGNFAQLGSYAQWWVVSENDYNRVLKSDSYILYGGFGSEKFFAFPTMGFSVRCVKN